MKQIKTTVTLLLASAFLTSNAQNSTQKWGLGLQGGVHNYRGDLGNGLFTKYKAGTAFFGGLSLNRYLNPSFDAGLGVNYGGLKYRNQENNSLLPITGGNLDVSGQSFKTSLLDYSLGLRYKFNNGYILKEEAKIKPFIGAGVGMAHSLNPVSTLLAGTETKGANLTRFNLPVSAGFNFALTDRLNLLAQASYNFIASDRVDAVTTETKNMSDKFLAYGLGLTYALGKPKDTDGDGVPDKLDKCPDTRAGVKVNLTGCDLDTDGDGVADADDACPADKGTLNGCPDTDGDGIRDLDDKCPQVKGIAAFGGCPDTDGDGIQDSEDKCPKVKGIAAFGGCPDTDGDGIQDSEDNCPTVKGIAAMGGCPDTDGDGIKDSEDKCPTIAGTAASKGCPEVNQAIIAKAAKSAKAINFQTGSDVILKTSYKDLDSLVSIMKSEADLKAEIQGHTDNTGDATKNKTLSQKRADAVMKYLTEKGIDPKRLTAVGYGQEVPLKDNKTAAGKAANRRVEFKLSY
jgi:OmpA-OmpF porin, OOP family